MHVEFNSKDQLCFLLADSEADSGKLLISLLEPFYRLMNAPEVLLFLLCQNDILLSLSNLIVALLLKFNKC